MRACVRACVRVCVCVCGGYMPYLKDSVKSGLHIAVKIKKIVWIIYNPVPV